MTTLELTDEELDLLLSALHSALDDFDHEEAEVLRNVEHLLAEVQVLSA